MITTDEVSALERADRLLLVEGVTGDRGAIASMILESVHFERDACAEVADSFALQGDWDKSTADCISASIRSRAESAE